MRNLAELIFLNMLDQMKAVLDLGEYRLGADQKAFAYFKRVIMDIFYERTKQLLSGLEHDGWLTRCTCESNLRHGYTQCASCHGAGYVNAFGNEREKYE